MTGLKEEFYSARERLEEKGIEEVKSEASGYKRRISNLLSTAYACDDVHYLAKADMQAERLEKLLSLYSGSLDPETRQTLTEISLVRQIIQDYIETEDLGILDPALDTLGVEGYREERQKYLESLEEKPADKAIL